MQITTADSSYAKDLALLRHALFDYMDAAAHLKFVSEILDSGNLGGLPLVFLIAEVESTPVGFIEVGIRSRADGCDPLYPVAYVEAWYVLPEFKGQGIGKALIEAAKSWAREQGCREMASDALLDNPEGNAAHLALGFEEVDRCVNYRMSL